MSNFLIYLNILINRGLMLLGLRHRQAHWGVVYDSVSKQPLDPVIVKLIDADTGKVAQTGVTDLSGRYNFLAYPGKFKILVKKSNYLFPSQIVGKDKDMDEVYSNLYHGEFFVLGGDSDVIPFNIPMDPEHKDWNQSAKAGIVKFHPFTENLFHWLSVIVFWFVLVLAVLSLIMRRSVFAYTVAGFYVFIFLLSVIVPEPRWWGRVRYKKAAESSAQTFVELSYRQMPEVIVAKAQVQEDGKFFLRIEPGKYLMQIRRQAENQQPELLKSKVVRVGLEQIVNKNFDV